MENVIKGRYNKYQIITAFIFLLPTMIMLLVFCYYPSVSAILTSFTKWDGFNEPEFIGLGNYIELFQDKIFLISLINVFKWSIGSILIALTAPLIAAEFIFHLRNKKAQYWYRVIFVIPMVVPAVVIIQIWTFIYNPEIGLLNKLFEATGMGGYIQNWLGDSQWVIPSLIFIGFPWVSGLNLLIYYAGLQSIPMDVIEYSQLDGCTGIRRILKIDLPLILGQIKLLLILSIINTLQNVTVPLLMTSGGPGYDSYVPGLYMYFKAFELSDFGYSTTIATFMFFIIFVLTLISMRINKTDAG